MKKTRIIIVLALLLRLPAAFADTAHHENVDPLEPYNRAMFYVNAALDTAIIEPTAKAYRHLAPEPIRAGVKNFFNNIRDLVSASSNLLRLDIERASTDFVRFGLNSTFGLAGFIDIADAAAIPNNKNTLGDTFATWGWKNSSYFVLPILGPSTVRDGLGSTISYVFPAQNLVFQGEKARLGATAVWLISARESLLDVTKNIKTLSLDPYIYVRDLYLSNRNVSLGNSAALPEDIDIDSLVEPSDGAPELSNDAASETGETAATSVQTSEKSFRKSNS